MPSPPGLAIKMEEKMSKICQINEQRISSVFSTLDWTEALKIYRKRR